MKNIENKLEADGYANYISELIEKSIVGIDKEEPGEKEEKAIHARAIYDELKKRLEESQHLFEIGDPANGGEILPFKELSPEHQNALLLAGLVEYGKQQAASKEEPTELEKSLFDLTDDDEKIMLEAALYRFDKWTDNLGLTPTEENIKTNPFFEEDYKSRRFFEEQTGFPADSKMAKYFSMYFSGFAAGGVLIATVFECAAEKRTIKELRQNSGEEPEETAFALGVSKEKYLEWENNFLDVPVSKAMEIAEHFKTTVGKIKA